jgi:hypothetical protein
MNSKTGKLLRKYAKHSDMTTKEVRKWWDSLPWTQRAAERRRIRAALAGAHGAPSK